MKFRRRTPNLHARSPVLPRRIPPALAGPEREPTVGQSATAESTSISTPEALAPPEITLLRASIAAIAPVAGEVTVYFYAILFTRYPQVRDLFPANLDIQRDRLLRGLLQIVDLIDDPDGLTRFSTRLGRGHRKFGALSGHYPAVGACLLESMARFAGPVWTPAMAAAWSHAYGSVAQMMVLAAEADAHRHPATWSAEVIRHIPRGNGIAEITIRPHAPYPYLAGQYVSLETPWHPKAWRYYSPSHAPRPDATLTFHVRAIRGGQVSTALVHHAQVGDTVRLGPAEGDMVLNPQMEFDLLCVAGGTGLAPIRALVEQAARTETGRSVEVFIGARTADELYGLDDMLRMAQRHHWLSVRAALSEQHLPGNQGPLPHVLKEFGPWYTHEAFISGPIEMVASSVHTLRRRGFPPDRIHHDPFDSPMLDLPRRRSPVQHLREGI